jgi:hypothetical protein
VSPVMYELGIYIPEDGILNSHRRKNLRCLCLEMLSVLPVFSTRFRLRFPGVQREGPLKISCLLTKN